MTIQDYYKKTFAMSEFMGFNELNRSDLKTVKWDYRRYLFYEKVKSIKNFLWENAITILTLILGVLAISYGIAIQIFKIINTDA